MTAPNSTSPDASPPLAPSSSTGKPGAPRLTRALLPIFLIVLVDIFGFTLVIPLLAIYAESPAFRATPLEATLLVSTYAACQLLAGPFLGRLSDRVGRKPILLVSQVGTLIGFIVMARAHALWMLYLARVIDGVTAGNLTIAQAYISDNTKPEDRAKSFALIGIAFGLGFFLGPAVTGKLSDYGLTAPIYLAAAMSATSILCTLFFLPGGKPSGVGHDRDSGAREADAPTAPGGKRLGVLDWGSYAEYLRRPVLSSLFLQFFCFTFGFSTFTSCFALFAERRFTWHGHPFGPHEVGYLFGFTGFLGIILQGGLIGRLVKRFGEAALARAGFLAVFLAMGGLGFIHSVPPLLVVAALSSFGTGVLRPTITSLITRNAGRHEQGAVLGLNQSLNSIAQISAPILGGFLIASGQLAVWAWVGSLAALVGFTLSRAAARAADKPVGSVGARPA